MKLEMDKNTRAAFGEALLEAAAQDERIVFVGGDSVSSMGLTPMEKKYPERTLNMGIAEQDSMAVAAGMASCGMKVVVGGFAPFVSLRAIEQFRTFIAYPNFNVLVVGAMGGLSGSTEGVTHQGLEDYGIMRMMPNTVIGIPCDAASTKAIAKVLFQHEGPAYTRLGKGAFYKVYEEYEFELGKAHLLRDGNDLTIIACGPVLPNVVNACEALEQEGVHVRVLDMASVKPLDEKAVLAAVKETGAVLTVEDHHVVGGLGTAVAEVLAEASCAIPFKRLGIPDVFTQSGEHYALLDYYGLGAKDIAEAAKQLLIRKS